MKRTGNLYPEIHDFSNLLTAAYRSRSGKRYRPDVADFHFHLEESLLELAEELREKRYQPGAYRTFFITDPKRRLISAAPYRDRVVHHALYQVIEPVFERTFVHDSYANRTGKGTHAAVNRATYFARRYPYVLKCDIEKYFPSIDHAVLMSEVERKIKCKDTPWLLGRIVNNSNEQEEVIRYFPGDTLFTPLQRRKGIPIGNLTSQFLANVYLNRFDHFVRDESKAGGYVRFCDDFLVFGESAAELRGLIPRIRERLDGLRLCLHPRKCEVMPVTDGIPFLGWRVYPSHRKIRRQTGVRFARQLAFLSDECRRGRVTREQVNASVMSWIGHLRHGDTHGLQRKLFGRTKFVWGAGARAAREGSGG